jgi:uncharacterized membrane protein YozB (DUF420 family)
MFYPFYDQLSKNKSPTWGNYRQLYQLILIFKPHYSMICLPLCLLPQDKHGQITLKRFFTQITFNPKQNGYIQN